MELRVELGVELRLALGAALSAMTQSMHDQDWTTQRLKSCRCSADVQGGENTRNSSAFTSASRSG